MFLRRILFVSLAFALAGCTTLQAPAPSDDQQSIITPEEQGTTLQERIQNEYQAQAYEVSRRIHAVCTARGNQPYYNHTACLPRNLSEKELNSKVLPTRNELSVAKSVFEQLNELTEGLREWMKSSGSDEYKAKAYGSEEHYVPQVKTLQKEFLKGKMTWGDFNKRRLQLYRQSVPL